MSINQLAGSSCTKAVVAASLALQLIACGGGGGGSNTVSDSASASNVSASKVETEVPSTPTDDKGVTPGANTGNLKLQWTAPVARSDGTPLSLADVDGFRIRYGTQVGKYTNHVNVADGTAQKITLKKVPAGTYYIVMTTYDVNGLESSYSPIVTKTVM